MEHTLNLSNELRAASRRPVGDALRVAALVSLLAALGAAGTALDSRSITRPPGSRADGAGWEARRIFAQLMWVRIHAVLHAGVEERSARKGEELSRSNEIHFAGGSEQPAHPEEGGTHDEHAGAGHHEGDGHDHTAHGDAEGTTHADGHVLVIPPAREDFRGILGDLERAIKPYAAGDGKLFSKGIDQTLPFYRLATWADPHFIQGYSVGATMLSDGGKRPDEGIAFLKEGERFNPDSFEIQAELGHFYLMYKKDYTAAARCLRRAVTRLPRGRKLTELEEEARADTYRWLAYTYVMAGKPGEAIQAAREGERVVGEDVSFTHILQHRGHNWRRGQAP